MTIKCENSVYSFRYFEKRHNEAIVPGIKVTGKNEAILYRINKTWISYEDDLLIPADHIWKFIDIIEQIYIFDDQKN